MTEYQKCTRCDGTGEVEEQNLVGMALGIAVFGGPIPLGTPTVKVPCPVCKPDSSKGEKS